MRALGLNIYMYIYYEICTKSLIQRENYKRYIYIYPPNSRWINDTEFGEVEPVLNSGLCLSKKISN